MTLLNQIATQQYASPKQYNPKIPDFLVKVIEKALTKDVNSRFQKASEMATVLKSYLAKVNRAIAAKRKSKQASA